jgi:transcriptional regulator with XRE-family HTH domain
MTNDLDPRLTPTQRFGRELSRIRRARGLSQSALAARLGISKSLVGHIEIGDRTPREDLARRCDEVFGSDDFFKRLCRSIDAPMGPGWYIRWSSEIEPHARALRSWDPLLIPGLLQIEDYVRALLRGGLVDSTEREVEDGVDARMRRQIVFAGERPPSLWVLLDEGVLYRLIGTAETMMKQLDHVLTMAGRPNVNVQVIPRDTPCTAGLASGFIIAEMPDAPTVVSVESAGEGEVSADHDFVLMIWGAYDKLRAEALSSTQSLDKIKEAREQWKLRT